MNIIFYLFPAIAIYGLNYSALYFGYGYTTNAVDTMITWNINKNFNIKFEENIFLRKRHKRESK
jgi:hypothetical protein